MDADTSTQWRVRLLCSLAFGSARPERVVQRSPNSNYYAAANDAIAANGKFRARGNKTNLKPQPHTTKPSSQHSVYQETCTTHK